MSNHAITLSPWGAPLWLTGGYNDARLRSTNYVYLNGNVKEGPDLPNARSGHCMVRLDDGRVMIVGGSGATSDVKIYDANTKIFTAGPRMIHNRISHMCAVFRSKLHGNREVVLVAGGKGSTSSGLRASEILDYTMENAKWEESKYLLNIQFEFPLVYTRIRYLRNVCFKNTLWYVSL